MTTRETVGRENEKGKGVKIALVCTKGGHFEQMTNLCDFYDRYDHFWMKFPFNLELQLWQKVSPISLCCQ